MHPLIKEVEKRFLKQHEEFRIGDRVRLHLEIVEGEKKRIQIYEGDVIRQRGEGNSATITVRKISAGVSVEKILPLSMPALKRIEVIRKGKVRRAKLYYMVRRMGKASKIKEEIGTGVTAAAGKAKPVAG
jgi:large subunit ribosomal protein L19